MRTAIMIGVLTIIPLVVAFSFFAAPVPLVPEHEAIITEKQPTFVWEGHATHLVIDDNPSFSSPIVEKVTKSPHTLNKELDFTTYHWKVQGERESKASQFTIESIVALDLVQRGNAVELTNSGTTTQNISIEEHSNGFWGITGNIILEEKRTITRKLSKPTLFIAKQE